MSLRPPRLARARTPPGTVSGRADDPLAATLDQEIVAEKFATLARLVEKLERALAALTSHAPEADGQPERLAAASQALYHLVVQRDLLRLPATERFLAELGVPDALMAQVLPPRRARPGRRRR